MTTLIITVIVFVATAIAFKVPSEAFRYFKNFDKK